MNESPAEELPPRLQEFQNDVDDLKLTGGSANPERRGMILGIVLFVAAVVIEIVAFSSSQSATDPRDQNDMIVLALLGVVLAFGGIGIFVRYSLTRWFRYWLVRLIYEDRAQTDRIVDALGGDD